MAKWACTDAYTRCLPQAPKLISTSHKLHCKENKYRESASYLLRYAQSGKHEKTEDRALQPLRVKLFLHINLFSHASTSLQIAVAVATSELKGRGYLGTLMKLSVPLKQPAGKAHGLVNVHPTSSPNRASEVPQTAGHSLVWGTVDRIHSLPFPLTSSVLPIVDASEAWRHPAACENLSSFRQLRVGSC